MSHPGQLAGDLYRDLRDRRLLPVVIALGAAILAVPVLLKSDVEAPPPAPAPAATTEDQVAPTPAVLVGDEGVRNYRKRLKLLRSKNPFEAKFAPPPVSEGVGLEDISETGSGGSTSVTIEEPSSTSSSGTEASSGSTGVSSGGESSGSGSSSTGGGSSESELAEEPKLKFYSYRVDLEIGPKGEVESHEGIKRMTVLPGAANPVTIFLGVTENADKAIFQLSADVTSTSGDGSCLPGAAECTYLALKEGERRELVYQPEGEGAITYVLELTQIDVVKVKDPRDGKDEKRARRAGASSGGTAFLGAGS